MFGFFEKLIYMKYYGWIRILKEELDPVGYVDPHSLFMIAYIYILHVDPIKICVEGCKV